MATTHEVKQLAIFRQEAKGGICWNRDPGEEASQVWTKGTPLIEDASSLEMEAHTSAGTVTITGVAAGPASGTAGTDVPYYEANPYNIFVATLRNGSAAIALATTHINTAYGLIVTATADTYVDINNTTQTVIQVLGPAPGYDIGDSNARVLIRFLSDEQHKLAAVATA